MALDKNFVGELTARVLRNHIEDMRNNNLEIGVRNYDKGLVNRCC